MRIRNSGVWAWVVSLVALGCAPASGTQPHAMSAAAHETAAGAEEVSSNSDASESGPAASAAQRPCTRLQRRARACWTSEEQATRENQQEAERHRQLAAQHRAASTALRSAEAAACADLSDDDRDMSPFMHREDIRSISPLEEALPVGEGSAPSSHVVGARVVFAAVPGMTAEWLQRVVDCHLARNAAIGHEVASHEMPYCPLTLRGAQAHVQSVGNGFAVDIRADEAKTAKEILARAESLRPPPERR